MSGASTDHPSAGSLLRALRDRVRGATGERVFVDLVARAGQGRAEALAAFREAGGDRLLGV